MNPRQRRAARIVALSRSGRVLLFQHARQSGERFWATPGGGLEDGETYEQAAARELLEELSLKRVRLEPLWRRSATFPWGDHKVHQQERFFLIRVEPSELGTALAGAHRLEGIVDTRWWSLDELQRTTELIFPESLAEDLKHLLAG